MMMPMPLLLIETAESKTMDKRVHCSSKTVAVFSKKLKIIASIIEMICKENVSYQIPL